MHHKHTFLFGVATLLCGVQIVQIAKAQNTAVSGWLPFRILPIVQGPSMARPSNSYDLISPKGTMPLVYRRTIVTRKDGQREEKVEDITITADFISKSQAMLNDAANLAKQEGFRAPILEKVDGMYIGRVHPGTFACDEDTGCDPNDETYGVYRGTSKSGGTSVNFGKLFLSDSWPEAKTAVVPHELFHSIVAAYPSFSGKAREDERCPTACWLSEGLAEGFAKYWADKNGKAFGFSGNVGYLRSRDYTQPLATGQSEEDYDDGLATGRFWRFVAKSAGSYRPIHIVLESNVSVQANNGVNVVDAALRKSMQKSLSDLYGEFVRLELKADSRNDFSQSGTFNLDPDIKETDSVVIKKLPFLASFPIKVSIKADALEWPTLKISIPNTADQKTRVYWGNREIKGELKLSTKHLPRNSKNKEENTYEIWLKVANTNLSGPTQYDGHNIKFEWLRDKCALLPNPDIKRMAYKMDSPTVVTSMTYDFGVHKKVGDEVHFPAKTRFQSREKNGKLQANGQSDAIWKCTPKGVEMDGIISGASLSVKIRDNAKIQTVSNTVYYPSSVKAGQALPNGSVTMRLDAAGGTALNFTTNYTNRRVVGQQTITIPGVGKTKCWVITSNISYGASAGKGMENIILAQLKKNRFYQTPAGKAMLADPSFRRTILGTANSMLGSFTAQSGGSYKVWFKRGLGLVKTETKDKKTGQISTTILQNVVYK
jgi:hypothetical protein